jgi:hypothetical protein
VGELTADECGDVDRVLQMLVIQAGRYRSASRQDEALRLNHAAVSLVDSVGIRSELAASACGNLAWALVEQSSLDEALAVVQGEQVILESLDAPAARAECFGRHAVILSDLGREREALDLHR